MVRTHVRKRPGKRGVKVDSNPLNGYFDGYNAARRWAKDKITKSKIGMVVFCVGSGIVIGLLIAYLASL